MSERKLYELAIDPELRDLIPPLTENERMMLTESIIANGCETPLTVWNGVLVDGHNRYAICHEHGVPFEIREKSFESREEVICWMYRNQIGRRNLNDFQRAEIALKLKELYAREAQKRMRHQEDSGVGEPETDRSRGSKPRTMQQLGEMVGVSGTTMKRVQRLAKDADEETKRKLRAGEVAITNAYEKLVGKQKESNQPDECGIHGMTMHNGSPIHVETQLPDTPDMFRYVADLVKSCCESYVIGLTSAMRRYSEGMGSDENNGLIMSMVRKTNAQVMSILDERMRGM